MNEEPNKGPHSDALNKGPHSDALNKEPHSDALIDILEKVQDATDASGAEADAMEALLLEDPVTFAGRYRDHLTERDRRLLGAATVG